VFTNLKNIHSRILQFLLLLAAAQNAGAQTTELLNPIGVLPTPAGEIFDASNVEWDVHIGGLGRSCALGTYPLSMRWHANQTLRHARIQGNIADELSQIGVGEFCNNSVGLWIGDNAANATVDGIRIDGAWDAIRVTGTNAADFTITNSWVSDNRSRCFQNLNGSSGSINDSLFEGCFNGIYVGGTSPSNTLLLDSVLLQVAAFDAVSKPAVTVTGDGSGNVLFGSSGAPNLVIKNSVFAYDSPFLIAEISQLTNMIGDSSGRISSCNNNQLLWSSQDLDFSNDDWYPRELKQLRGCFEVISGLHAKVEWDRKRCEWINKHPDAVTDGAAGSTRRNSNDLLATCNVSDIAELDILAGPLYIVDNVYNDEGVQFRRFADNKVYDASYSEFMLNNCLVENPDDFPGDRGVKGCADQSSITPKPVNYYPISLRGAQNTIVRPLVLGEVPQSALWHLTYVNSTAIFLGAEAINSKVYGARINNSWDAIRLKADNFVISDVYVTGGRDDCIENDFNKSGQIIDSLFDGCNFGLSMRQSSATTNAELTETVLIDGLLMRMTEHRELQDERDSDSEVFNVLRYPFKVGANSAGVEIYNTVFAFDGAEFHPHGGNQLKTVLVPNPALGIDKLKGCGNNKILWMDSDELPAELTEFTIPSCFEVITGVEARNVWESARCEWLDAHPETITRRMEHEPIACSLPEITSISSTATTITLGESVTLASTVTASYEDIQWRSSLDGAIAVNGLKPNFDTLTVGEHNIIAEVTNAEGAKAYAETTVNVIAPNHAVSLSSDLAWPLTEGDITNLSAILVGGLATDYLYQFEFRNVDSDVSWQALNPFAETASQQWNTNGENGNYRLRVTAQHKLDSSFELSSHIMVYINSDNPVLIDAQGINFDGGKIEFCDDGTDSSTNHDTNNVYHCDQAASSDADDVYIASGFTVKMNTDQNPLLVASAILGAEGRLEGDLLSYSTVALGAKAEINGNVTSTTSVALGVEAVVTGRLDNIFTQALTITAGSTLALGANAIVNGNVQAATTIAVGANGEVNGNVNALTTVALGADAIVYGNVDAGTTLALGANAYVTEDAIAGTTVALGAGAYVLGNVTSRRSSVTLGVAAYVMGTTTAASTATLGAGAYTCNSVNAPSAATLGVGSFVDGDLNATTMTVAAGSFVTNDIIGTTGTLGANACYGNNFNATTKTQDAGAGKCGENEVHSYNGTRSDTLNNDFKNCT
jgi:predicted acyltransferase (DUF342 family)